MRNTRHLTSLALALALAGVVSAQSPASSQSIDFASLDANGDGRISLSEVQYVDDLRSTFAALDANRDENLTPTEYSQWDRAARTKESMPLDPSTGPSGSNGSQHMPKEK